MAVGNRYTDHVTPLYPQKLALTSPIGGGRSVGIVHSRTKAMEFSFSLPHNLVTLAQPSETRIAHECNIGHLTSESFSQL